MTIKDQIDSLTVERYKTAFESLCNQITETQWRLLRLHYDSKDITANQMANAVGFKKYNASNLHYGGLANKLCKFFDIYPEFKLEILAEFEKRENEWHWIIREKVIQAIQELNLFNDQKKLTITEEIENFRDSHKDLEKTMRESIIQSRIGQGEFRDSLISYWKACSVTGYKKIELLRASHIKPWRFSDNDERLDVYNGLLLLPNIDACFDSGLISFKDNGDILISQKLDKSDLQQLGIDTSMKLSHVDHRHLKYLKFHREHIFQH